jgi:hypothetical protein
MNQTLRFPAEWEAQSGVLIAWPTADTDWADRLGQVEETYIALVAAITRFQPVLICVADDDVETYAEMRLRSNRIDMDKVHFTTAAYDDTWLRDSGPITCAVPTAASSCWISASPAGAASSTPPWMTSWWACSTRPAYSTMRRSAAFRSRWKAAASRPTVKAPC